MVHYENIIKSSTFHELIEHDENNYNNHRHTTVIFTSTTKFNFKYNSLENR